MGIKQDKAALNVMARVWPLRLRCLHADFCAGERVMIKREPARLRAGARDDETRTEAVKPLHRQTRDDNVNHAYYTPSGPPLVAESHTLKPPA